MDSKEHAFLQEINQVAGLKIYLEESMAKHTSFKVGGPADILLIPNSIEQVGYILPLVQAFELPLTVLGNGSNVLVRDKGIRGVVLKFGNGLKKLSFTKEGLECEAGMLLSTLAQNALHNSLTGLEFAAGIPGSVGGGICMNAGAYEGELQDVVESVTSIDLFGQIKVRDKQELGFAYRSSIFLANQEIVLSAKFKLAASKQETIKEMMDDFAERRRSKQPLEYPSAGSIFKRPYGHFAGKLIQDAGLCGYTIGGAQVSEKHAGFIINKCNASADDILALIDYVRAQVEKLFCVNLELEVKVIGE